MRFLDKAMMYVSKTGNIICRVQRSYSRSTNHLRLSPARLWHLQFVPEHVAVNSRMTRVRRASLAVLCILPILPHSLERSAQLFVPPSVLRPAWLQRHSATLETYNS